MINRIKALFAGDAGELSRPDELQLAAAALLVEAALLDGHFDDAERANIAAHLAALEAMKLIAPIDEQREGVYAFVETATLEAAYGLMLFAQRRQLHRAVAEWHERTYATNLAPHYATLARHWRAADEPAKAVHYLEKAGELARHNGAYEEARRFFTESLSIDATASVLSERYGH